MRLIDILSKRLPDIDESVKECVNLGEWLLFKSDKRMGGRSSAGFYLKTGSAVFELDDSGRVLQEVKIGTADLEIDEIFYFSDVRKPTSISNTRL